MENTEEEQESFVRVLEKIANRMHKEDENQI